MCLFFLQIRYRRIFKFRCTSCICWKHAQKQKQTYLFTYVCVRSLASEASDRPLRPKPGEQQLGLLQVRPETEAGPWLWFEGWPRLDQVDELDNMHIYIYIQDVHAVLYPVVTVVCMCVLRCHVFSMFCRGCLWWIAGWDLLRYPLCSTGISLKTRPWAQEGDAFGKKNENFQKTL